MNMISDRLSIAENGILKIFNEAERLQSELQEIRKLATTPEPEQAFDPKPPVHSPTPPPLPTQIAEEEVEEQIPVLAFPDKPTSVSKPDRAALEMHLGRVWAVRLGIVMLTTGLVFLSRYTYDNVIRDLGPGIRLGLLYLFSFILAGAGLFFEQWKESLKSYGRIVAAGGFAAIFYCGFAAHNVEALRVIESPIIASILLTASAGLLCAVSLKRESRVMLATGLGLAFYSISVNPIGWMACLSALVLATFGVIMMVRTRWSEIGFVVLLGSYFSYFWWQVAVNPGSNEAQWFLPAYWILFVAASIFATKDLREEHHGTFASFNHAAFYLLFAVDWNTGSFMEDLWFFSLLLGVAILAIGILARKAFPSRTTFLHLAKGTALVTLGISLKLSGYQLFLSLLIEALLLIAIHHRTPHPVTRAAAWGIAIFSNLALIGHSANVTPAAWLVGTGGWLAFGMIDRAAETRKLVGRFHIPGVLTTLIAMIFLVGGFAGDWGALKQVYLVTSLGLVATVLLSNPRHREPVLEPLWTLLVLSLLAALRVFDLSSEALPFVIVSILTLAISLLHTRYSTGQASEELENLHQLIAGLALGLSVSLAMAAIHFSDFSSEVSGDTQSVPPVDTSKCTTPWAEKVVT